VNGRNAHPIFKFLKSKLGGGIFGSKIKWNFTKFLINNKGVPKKRFGPTTIPKDLEKDIEKLL
jgi:glutathione peroxidase